jgi:hypothetical protein
MVVRGRFHQGIILCHSEPSYMYLTATMVQRRHVMACDGIREDCWNSNVTSSTRYLTSFVGLPRTPVAERTTPDRLKREVGRSQQ